jgi:phosphatidylinositol alpha-mannosyltransferase
LYDDALTRELSQAKLLVAPSVGSESFGMVLTRAFSCGTPVVASDIPGYRAIVTQETGFLSPPRDVDALGESVVAALADESRRRELGAAAREIAQAHYSWSVIALRLQEIYQKLASKS